MDVDGEYTDMDIIRPRRADQPVPARDLAGSFKQMPQQVELERPEMDV